MAPPGHPPPLQLSQLTGGPAFSHLSSCPSPQRVLRLPFLSPCSFQDKRGAFLPTVSPSASHCTPHKPEGTPPDTVRGPAPSCPQC